MIDLDGTILGNRPLKLSLDFAKQALGALRKYGGWRNAVRALYAIQKEFGKVSPNLTNDKRVIAAFAEQIGTSLEEARKILKENLLLIFPKLEKHFFPMDGAKEFLEWASSRYTLILATNPVWPVEVVELRVKWAGIDPKIFGFITDVRKMRACKPAPEYYQQILDEQGIKASECFLVGNEIKMDLPATRVGIAVFIVDSSKKLEPLKSDSAPAWRGSFKDLKSILLKAESKSDL